MKLPRSRTLERTGPCVDPLRISTVPEIDRRHEERLDDIVEALSLQCLRQPNTDGVSLTLDDGIFVLKLAVLRDVCSAISSR